MDTKPDLVWFWADLIGRDWYRWDLSGSVVYEPTETWLCAAHRELYEESGLEAQQIRWLPALQFFETKKIHPSIVYYVALYESEVDFEPQWDPLELSLVKWYDLHDVLNHPHLSLLRQDILRQSFDAVYGSSGNAN